MKEYFKTFAEAIKDGAWKNFLIALVGAVLIVLIGQTESALMIPGIGAVGAAGGYLINKDDKKKKAVFVWGGLSAFFATLIYFA